MCLDTSCRTVIARGWAPILDALLDGEATTRIAIPTGLVTMSSTLYRLQAIYRTIGEERMPKRIALCFDGTWNTPSEEFAGLAELHARFRDLAGLGDDEMRRAIEHVDPAAGVETNVCRLYRSVLRFDDDTQTGSEVGQTKWYDKGVGTDWYDRVRGGAFGLGLSRKIREGYQFLSDTYDAGDEVYVFGFSRGAYTARSFVGMIRNCGLLPKGGSGGDPDSAELLEAYELYRTRDNSPDSERARHFRDQKKAPLIPIKFLGVWDTVGALGIPLESFDSFNKEQFEFHDTELSGIVQNAFHAIAVDEHREPYRVTLWDPKEKPNQTVEQCWFIGAHADVGGGYPTRTLSDITLRWMQKKAQDCGLRLDEKGIPEVSDESAFGHLADSFKAFLGGVFALFGKRYYRPVLTAKFGFEIIDETVPSRIKRDVSYRPKNAGLMEALKETLGMS
jgi:uncharacterized protein (DUF2235 family)